MVLHARSRWHPLCRHHSRLSTSSVCVTEPWIPQAGRFVRLLWTLGDSDVDQQHQRLEDYNSQLIIRTLRSTNNPSWAETLTSIESSGFSGPDSQHRSVADSSADNIRRRILPSTSSASAAKSTALDFHSCDCQQAEKGFRSPVSKTRDVDLIRKVDWSKPDVVHTDETASSRDTPSVTEFSTVKFTN